MPMRPRSGRAREMRHRKSWSSSSEDGCLNEDDLHPLRVHARHHVLDHGVLAGRVHRLQHDEQRVAVARPQQLLRLGERGDPARDGVLRPLLELVGGELGELGAATPPGVPARDARGLAGRDEEVVVKSLPRGHVCSSRCASTARWTLPWMWSVPSRSTKPSARSTASTPGFDAREAQRRVAARDELVDGGELLGALRVDEVDALEVEDDAAQRRAAVVGEARGRGPRAPERWRRTGRCRAGARRRRRTSRRPDARRGRGTPGCRARGRAAGSAGSSPRG